MRIRNHAAGGDRPSAYLSQNTSAKKKKEVRNNGSGLGCAPDNKALTVQQLGPEKGAKKKNGSFGGGAKH